MTPTIRLDTREFDRTMREYARMTNRAPSIIVNTKAFYVARGACRETFRPSKEDIKRDLENVVKATKTSKSGKAKKSWAKTVTGAPIVALLINWKRGLTGEKGLFGSEMKAAIKRFIGARQAARAYMASGWVPAIKGFESLAEKKGGAPRADQLAMKKRGPGSFTAAREGIKAIARLVNMAFSKHSTTKDPDMKVAFPALQRAINKEAASMKQYIERKYKELAQRAGIRTA